MQSYAYEPSFIVGQTLNLCVTPNKQFSIALYRQGAGEALVAQPWRLSTTSNVQVVKTTPSGRIVFRSGNARDPGTFDQDWQWPEVGIKSDRTTWRSGIYIAAPFEVDA